MAAYKRVIIKISGEALGGDAGSGLDEQFIDRIAEDIIAVKNAGVQIGIVVGQGGQMIKRISMTARRELERVWHKHVDLRVEVRDAGGKPVPALLPVSFTIRLPDGKELPVVYDCAKNGVLEREFLIPLNAPPGEWKLVVRDRASGADAQSKFTVKGR